MSTRGADCPQARSEPQTLSLVTTLSTTARQLKEQICAACPLLSDGSVAPSATATLLARGRRLDNDDATVEAAGISHRATLTCACGALFSHVEAGCSDCNLPRLWQPVLAASVSGGAPHGRCRALSAAGREAPQTHAAGQEAQAGGDGTGGGGAARDTVQAPT